MTNITDEMAAEGAKVLDAVPCLDAANFRQVVRDVYAAMEGRRLAATLVTASEAGGQKPPTETVSEIEWRRIAEICLPRPKDGHVLRMRADGTVEAVPHPAVNRTGEAEGPNIPTAATKLRPDFGDRGGSSGFYKMSPEQLAKYRASCSYITPRSARLFVANDKVYVVEPSKPVRAFESSKTKTVEIDWASFRRFAGIDGEGAELSTRSIAPIDQEPEQGNQHPSTASDGRG